MLSFSRRWLFWKSINKGRIRKDKKGKLTFLIRFTIFTYEHMSANITNGEVDNEWVEALMVLIGGVAESSNRVRDGLKRKEKEIEKEKEKEKEREKEKEKKEEKLKLLTRACVKTDGNNFVYNQPNSKTLRILVKIKEDDDVDTRVLKMRKYVGLL